uniref:SFRICE_017735 n=1 Tax=Spodoptera frugiperda TaxID=7108 RepID=A0A2H1VXX3_SPOFR
MIIINSLLKVTTDQSLFLHGEDLSINHHACSMRVGDFKLFIRNNKPRFPHDVLTLPFAILSTTGVIPKHLHQSIKTLELPPYTYRILQKAAILNTCHIVRKFLAETD